jgi:iron(III) transport system substrate-binding protein
LDNDFFAKETYMSLFKLLPLLAVLVPSAQVQAQNREVNIICSAQAAWCSMIAVTFEKSQGIKVNMTAKGSGEAIAQLTAEKANPKTDIWFGGTGDPHLQAAEQNLSLEYKSPALSKLHDWAQKQAAQSGYKTVGIYSGPLGFGYNTELLAKKKNASAQDLGRSA